MKTLEEYIRNLELVYMRFFNMNNKLLMRDNELEMFKRLYNGAKVLDILKQKVFSKDKTFDLDNGYYDDYFDLSEEDKKCIKRWLGE